MSRGDGQEGVLICRPVEWTSKTSKVSIARGSTRGWRCQRCAAEMWVSPDGLRYIKSGASVEVICLPCGLATGPAGERCQAPPGSSPALHEAVQRMGTYEDVRRLYGVTGG
jgi:hypothetical protein